VLMPIRQIVYSDFYFPGGRRASKKCISSDVWLQVFPRGDWWHEVFASGRNRCLLGAVERTRDRLVRTGRVKGTEMNWDQVQGKWKQYKGKAKEKWGELTDDELDKIDGRSQQLVGKIQERYGLKKEAAEQQANEFLKSLDDNSAEERREQEKHGVTRH